MKLRWLRLKVHSEFSAHSFVALPSIFRLNYSPGKLKSRQQQQATHCERVKITAREFSIICKSATSVSAGIEFLIDSNTRLIWMTCGRWWESTRLINYASHRTRILSRFADTFRREFNFLPSIDEPTFLPAPGSTKPPANLSRHCVLTISAHLADNFNHRSHA